MAWQSRPWNAWTAVSAEGDRGDLGAYSLVFEDDFDTLSVGDHHNKATAKWGDYPPYGAPAGFSFSHWMGSYPAKIPEVANVSGGVLKLWTKWYSEIADPGGRNWVSGCLASKDILNAGFAQRFGYWSAKMRMPNAGQGAWAAFWLASTAGIPTGAAADGYEVDILEFYGGILTPGTPPSYSETPWYDFIIHAWQVEGGEDSGCSGSADRVNLSDPVTNWHVYGVEVNTTDIIGYLDGVEVYRQATCADFIAVPLYIILNYAMQSWRDGEPFASLGPSAMEVDWVRAYSLPP